MRIRLALLLVIFSLVLVVWQQAAYISRLENYADEMQEYSSQMREVVRFQNVEIARRDYYLEVAENVTKRLQFQVDVLKEFLNGTIRIEIKDKTVNE